MVSGFDVLALFVSCPEESFTISDVMRKTPICWASARDHILDLKTRGWIKKNDDGTFILNGGYKDLIRNA